MRQTGRRGNPPWLWPLALVIAAGILAVYGRTFVYGLLGFLVISAGVAFVLVLLWGFLAMTRSGPRGALTTLPGSASELGDAVQGRLGRLRLAALGAPWRSPQRVVRGVIALLDDQVLELASAPSKYPQLTVSLHPATVAALDDWMPIESVALIWAEQYAAIHQDKPPAQGSVAVLVVAAAGVPVGRAIVEGSFRGGSPGDGAWALARCTFPEVGRSDEPGGTSVQRFQRQPATAPRDEPVSGDDRHHVDAAPRPGDPRAADAHHTDAHTTDEHPTDAHTTNPGTQVLDDGTADLHLDAEPDATATMVPVAGLPIRSEPAITVRQLDSEGGVVAGSVLTFLQPRVVIGRRPGSDVRLAEAYASRDHAELCREQDRWVVTDSGSTHGTYLNGTRIASGMPGPLRTGDRLQFGDPQPRTPAYEVELSSDTAVG